MPGKRRRRAAMMAEVSSRLRVVWVMTATRSGCVTGSVSASATEPINWMWSGACPMVPTTSSWPW